jgi:hypothetical protein
MHDPDHKLLYTVEEAAAKLGLEGKLALRANAPKKTSLCGDHNARAV